MEKPKLQLLAGPNGAGKSTFARSNFPELVGTGRFLNADDIARSLSPNDQAGASLRAARLALQRRQRFLDGSVSFAMETTLASRTLLLAVRHARRIGYRVELTYLYISNPQLCIQRIAQRVALGGHHIPVDVVMRRYEQSLRLLPRYLEVVDVADVYLADGIPRPVLRKDGKGTHVRDRAIWKAIRAVSE